jgi:hypothetical protein
MPYNPFGTAVSSGGTWADHLARTNGLRGGEDYPLAYGTTLPAPAAGRLQTLGGFGEFQAGANMGSAGRRSVLYLDAAISDVVAVVFQHQSVMNAAAQYAEGVSVGLSGASANGNDYGGDTHLHIHCLTASGVRRQFTRYFAVGGGPAPNPGGDSGSSTPGNLYCDPVTKQLFRVVDDGSDH